jgi:hypothetical protein
MRLDKIVIIINRKRNRIVQIDVDGAILDYGYLDSKGRPNWVGKRQPHNPDDYCSSSK